MSFLKPKAPKSSSSNINNDLIKSTYGSMMNQGTNANNFLSALLTGQGNTGQAQGGFQNYLSQAGFAPAMRQLSQNITGQGAASGLLNSGATAKALQTRGTELNQGFFNNYLQQLSGLSGQGLQAGGLVANTGNVSKSTGGGPSTAGSIGSAIGGIASKLKLGIFSDRELKRDIEKIGERPDGLGVYKYRYIGQDQERVGVMADEVAALRPDALGPVKHGFATVDYEAL
jgi:hypothetical protein